MKRFVTVSGMYVLLLCSMAVAAVPQLMSVQGILKDGSGNPVANGSYNVTFRIWDNPAGGVSLWSEIQSVSTSNGLFTVQLGSVVPLSESIFFISPRYLGMTVAPDTEMVPRQVITSAGYSMASSEWNSVGADVYRMSGRVGIGIASPNSQIHVHDPLNTINGSRLSLTQAASGTSAFDGFALIGTSPRAYVWNYENGPSIFGTNDLERMRIDSVGRVGIGTDDPESPLVVQGASNWGNVEIVAPQVNGEAAIGFRPSNIDKASPGSWLIGLNTNFASLGAFIIAQVGTGAAFTALSNGRVGIGDPSPLSPLVARGVSNFGVAEIVAANVNAEASIGFRAGNVSKGAVGSWVLGVNNPAGPTDAFSLYAPDGAGGGSQALTVLPNGRVGIGTSVPSAQLHVHDTTNGIFGSRLTLTQKASGTGVTDGMALICTSPKAYVWNYENGPSIFGTNNAERVRIDSVGRVGIGTAAPQGALDVSSTSGALIVPRMTTAQRDALTPVNGMIVYNTTTNAFNFREGGFWVTK